MQKPDPEFATPNPYDPAPPPTRPQIDAERAMLERISRERAAYEMGHTVAGHAPGRQRRPGDDG